jgi:phosphoserine phosphatase
MSHVLTCVAADYSMLDLLPVVHRALDDLQLQVERLDWLNPGRACDLYFGRGVVVDAVAAERAVRAVLGPTAVDIALQPVAGRRKRLLVADMESTVIRNEMLDELADFVGLRPQVERITSRAMNGELDFREALTERVALLRDLPVQVLHDCLECIRFDPGARVLIATLRAHGVHTALVSGGFTCFADWVRERVGFDVSQANELLHTDGLLTGTVGEPILDRDAKVEALRRLCAELGIEPGEAASVGDGANDLPMLQASGLGVAFHGKASVAAAARFRIDHGDLSTLLYFLGFRSDDLRHAAA